MLAAAKREPSAVLFAGQIAALLLYPFTEDSGAGRAVFSIFGIALLGLVVPLLSLIGAFRLGRPTSPWARLFYRSEKKKERARRRFADRRMLEPPHVPSLRHVRETSRGAGGGQAG